MALLKNPFIILSSSFAHFLTISKAIFTEAFKNVHEFLHK